MQTSIDDANQRIVTEARGKIAVAPKPLRKGGKAIGQRRVRMKHMMATWIQASEHRGVRRNGPLSGGICLLKTGRIFRERIEIWRCLGGMSITGKAVNTLRIQDEQHNIGTWSQGRYLLIFHIVVIKMRFKTFVIVSIAVMSLARM